MIILATLAMAMVVDGFLLQNPPSSINNNLFQRRCEQNGINYTVIENVTMDFAYCLQDNVQVKEIENEFRNAYVNHTYSAFTTVFKKYCPKVPELRACYNKLMATIGLCLGHENEDFIALNMNLNDRILNYLCASDGYSVTKFIMEGGPECFSDKALDLQMCVQQPNNLFLYTEQKITISTALNKYDEMMKCILRSVESCPNPTPSKIIAEVSDIIPQIRSELVLESSENVTDVKNYTNRWAEPTSTNTTQYSTPNQIPTNSTEKVLYEPTIKTLPHWRYASSSINTTKPIWYGRPPKTERDGYRPKMTTERKWYNPTTSSQRVWYMPTTTTGPQWYNPTTTTEKVWNPVSGTGHDEKANGLPAEVHWNINQGQLGQNGADHNTNEDTKHIGFSTASKHFKTSASVAVAFNADILF